MKIIEIFRSIEGEGIRTGKLSTFIRLAGCNLRCRYCDTQYSYEGGTEMTVNEVMQEVAKHNSKRITLTGGEPLIHQDVDLLLECLSREGYEINVETNGSVYVPPFFKHPNVFFTIDWKGWTSDMSGHNKAENLMKAREQDCIKFVVGCQSELDEMRKRLPFIYNCQNIYVSPVFGKIEPKEIVKYLQDHNLQQVTLQLQIHKIVWPPEMRGV